MRSDEIWCYTVEIGLVSWASQPVLGYFRLARKLSFGPCLISSFYDASQNDRPGWFEKMMEDQESTKNQVFEKPGIIKNL